jgi:hypothetical protein
VFFFLEKCSNYLCLEIETAVIVEVDELLIYNRSQLSVHIIKVDSLDVFPYTLAKGNIKFTSWKLPVYLLIFASSRKVAVPHIVFPLVSFCLTLILTAS